MGKPTPPTPPNPSATAAAQTQGDVQTAIANTVMGNANETNPYGSVKYTQSGSQNIRIPTTDAQGNVTGYQSIAVPSYNRDVTLNDQQQGLLNQQNQLGSGMNNLAISQVGQLQKTLGTPMDASGLPANVTSLNQPTFQQLSGPNADQMQQTSLPNSDYAGQRQSVENAIYSRINPQIDRDRAALETKLVNQGLVRGTDAFNTAMDETNRQANDARMQAVLAGGQEQSRLAGLDLQAGQYGNAGRQQNYLNQTNTTQANNELAQQGFGNQQAAGMFANTARQNALQEQLALRNQPINEVGALMQGGQVNVPQFAQYQGGQVAQSPIAQSVYGSSNIAQQNYNTQQQAQNAAIGAAAGVAGAGLYGMGSGKIKASNFTNFFS